jgi:hypothetical protein
MFLDFLKRATAHRACMMPRQPEPAPGYKKWRENGLGPEGMKASAARPKCCSWASAIRKFSLSIIPAGGNDGSDLEAQRGQRVSRDRVFEYCAKTLHHRPSKPRFGHYKIVVLVLCRDEAEPVLSGDSLDRDPPIGSVLRDGDTNGIVRLRL